MEIKVLEYLIHNNNKLKKIEKENYIIGKYCKDVEKVFQKMKNHPNFDMFDGRFFCEIFKTKLIGENSKTFKNYYLEGVVYFFSQLIELLRKEEVFNKIFENFIEKKYCNYYLTIVKDSYIYDYIYDKYYTLDIHNKRKKILFMSLMYSLIIKDMYINLKNEIMEEDELKVIFNIFHAIVTYNSELNFSIIATSYYVDSKPTSFDNLEKINYIFFIKSFLKEISWMENKII